MIGILGLVAFVFMIGFCIAIFHLAWGSGYEEGYLQALNENDENI